MIPRIAITAGEPAGIGPDLVVAIAQQDWPVELVVVGDGPHLLARAAQLGLPLTLHRYDPAQPPQPQAAGSLTLLPISAPEPVVAGQLNEGNGGYVVETLRQACHGCLNGQFAALVTGPVHKGIINQAGIAFSGHTEFFAQESRTAQVVMMLATTGLRVALATTHLPLAQVSRAITADRLIRVIEVLHQDLVTKFALPRPRIYVCGLNPHAGEGGHLGREEIEVIEPALALLRQRGMDLIGPLPADTLFQPKYLDQADAVLTMYHDQGLPVLKHIGFGRSVNITLGLPFIRTSVDHGTALDLAGLGGADAGSFRVALQQAIDLARLT